MKAIFIFLLCLASNSLFAVFNLDVKSNREQTQSQQSSSSTSSAPNSAPNQGQLVDLMSAMSPNERQMTGLNQLNSKQQAALSNWVSSWAEAQSLKAKSQGQGQLASNAVSAVVGNGHYVKLGDGSVWNVSPNAWIYTYYWQQGDIIKVGKSLDTLFQYSLTNENYNQTINAQKGSDDASSALENSYTISQVKEGGRFVTLDNGSIWQVASSDRYQSAGWSKGQQVFVVKVTQATGDQYMLLNGNNSRSVYSTSLKRGNSDQKSNANSNKTQVSTNAS
ncbi:MAG: hypothetical protein S4CHLAM6_04900 [Chlamydiae bacterium]|nr:hypothetical protein [Chlamydiota bacterium]